MWQTGCSEQCQGSPSLTAGMLASSQKHANVPLIARSLYNSPWATRLAALLVHHSRQVMGLDEELGEAMNPETMTHTQNKAPAPQRKPQAMKINMECQHLQVRKIESARRHVEKQA